MKVCTKCKIEKDKSLFCNNKQVSDGLHIYCKDCHNEKGSKWIAENPEGRRKISKAWRDKNKDYGRRWHLKARYGIDEDQYHKMLKEQGGVCAICKRKSNWSNSRLVVDHCHESGEVRALLCDPCNTGLGMFKDRTDLLLDAAKYLETFK